VLLSDILTRKLNGQEICQEDAKYIDGRNVKEKLLKLETALFGRDLENYFEIIFIQTTK